MRVAYVAFVGIETALTIRVGGLQLIDSAAVQVLTRVIFKFLELFLRIY